MPVIEMNGSHQNGKNSSFEKTFPGCLGRMVNFFDLNGAVAGNRLLTDKPHRDGSSLSRSRADEASMSPSNYQLEDKAIVPELNRTGSNRKSNVTPIKLLIAREMSKEVDSKHSPSNVVAKLMGLDAIPFQESDSAQQRSHFRGHPRSRSDIQVNCWDQQNEFLEYVEPNECSDVYAIRKNSQKTNYLLDKSPHKGKYYETTNDKKMALVRQKFIEAKRMSMDEKHRQSKQFHDALEVLNSNKDLFLRCLQEPNSTFSQNLYNLQSIPPPPVTKRITILRPSKMVESNNFATVGNKDGKQLKKGGLEKAHLRCSPPVARKIDKTPIQPTRIVVLKPSSVRPHDINSVDSPLSESPRILHGEDFFGDGEDNNKQESKEVAKAITQQMREKLHRDETLLSSMFSNGYVDDESSFNKSEIEYAEGNLSDSEVISPASRYSWDYVNRFGSPYSSSFSRAYSPESSVCREAKKRLSERWAMMTSNGSCQEQIPVRRSSSTLGEMLALSETKKVGTPKELVCTNEERRNSGSLFVSEQTQDENLDNSPRNLSRSKSVPVYSAEFGTRLNVDIPDPEVSKESTKTRSGKSSFKGKVSSLFFLRNKKPSKDKSECKDESRSSGVHFGQVSKVRGARLSDEGPECLSPVEKDPSIKAASPNLIGQQGMTSPKSGLSVTKSVAPRNPSENQDQPSPISVLDPNFEEDEHAALDSSSMKPDQHGFELPVYPVRSNLIDKSPPIGSIARTLPSDDLVMVDTASSYPLKPSLPSPGADEEEWFFFVQTLLSVAGLDGKEKPDSFLARWHSPESPLNPSLRDNYIDLNEKETLHEAKRRKKRSTHKLVFDCVNAALVDILGYGPASCQRAIPCIGANSSSLENASLMMVDQVWARMNIWFSGEARCVSICCGDENSLVVESVVRKEVVGKGWDDHLRLETDNLGKEIEGKLLEELVQDAVVELTGRL